jgi:hypothetical protein
VFPRPSPHKSSLGSGGALTVSAFLTNAHYIGLNNQH